MTIEEYRKTLIGGTQGSGSSSASSGVQALRERLLGFTPEMELEKIVADLNESYASVRTGMNAGDAGVISSALAAVRRNVERLQAYSGRHQTAGLEESLKTVRKDYQTMWLEYDRMKRRQAVESSPMASGLKTFGGVMGNYEPGKQLDTGIRGVDVERLADKDAGGGINLTAGAAAGVTMPESEELTEIQGKSGFRRSMENFGSWLKNVGIAGASGYAADMTGGIATGRSGSTAGKEFVSGALQSYIDQRDREQRFVDAYEAGDTSISRQDYEIAKEQIEFLQYYIDMYSKANETEQQSGEMTRDVAQDLYAVSDQHLQSALEGQNTVGQLFTTAGVAGVQQLMDLTLGAGIGGKGGLQAGAQAAMMLRSFGAGANEAAEKGSDATAQIAAGLKTAGIEYFTEKLFGGNPLYDVDVGLVNRAVRALGADKRVLAFLASKPVSVFSEGLEEVLSGVLNPVVDYIATGKADWPTVKQLVEEGIVGVMLGGAGQVVNTAVQDVTAARSDRALGQSILSGESVEGLRAAAELAGVKLGELNTPAEIGQAFRMVQDEYLNQAIQERAAALGETAGHTLGEAVLAKVREESLTKAQRKAYFGSAVADQIIEEYKAAMSGEITDDNRWVEDAYVRSSELGSYKTLSGTDALQEGAPETVADDLETVTNAPETVSESPMAEPAGIEEVSVPAVADISTMENTPGNDLMAREVENITGIEGMSDEAAMRYWGTEFTRIQMEITKAYANGDTEAAGVYEELNRLMGEAAVQGGGDIKATVAWLKGAIHGSNVSDGAGRRDAGERAGIEAGRVGPLEDGGNAGRESLRRGNEPAADGAVWESARTLGIPEGTEEKIIRRTPESRWTQGMKKAARTAADIGYELVYVNGPITLNRNGRRYQPGGVIFDKKIVVQADHRLYSAEQLAKHEIFHARLQEDRAMLQEIVSAFVSRHGEREVQNITQRYANGYGFIYGTAEEHMTADELEALDMMYLEEFICDAYSGINRAFMGGSNKVAQYSDIVMDIAESRIGMGNGSGGMPGARYSQDAEISEEEYTGPKLRSNYPGLTEYDRYLEGRKETRAEQDRPAMEADTIADREQSKELDILDSRNLARYRGEVYLTLNGEMPSHKSILVGRTPDILMRYGALDAPLYMPQKAVKKAVFDDSVKGGKHGLGEGVIYDLPGELVDPIAITGNTTTHKAANDRSIIVWTRWATENNDPIIVPIRIDISAENGERANNINTVFDVFNKQYQADLLSEENILYTKNNESIDQLLAQWRKVPKWAADDAFTSSIREYKEKVNAASKNPEESAKWSMDDAGKAPEEMTAAELRRAVQGDQSLLEAYARIERAGGMTPEARRERDAAASRLVKERELLQKKNEEMRAERQAVRERQKARTVPTRALADFEKEMLDAFSTQSGMRHELGAMVRRFGEDRLQRGAVSYEDRKWLMDRLYEAGAVSMEADEYARDIRSNIAGTRIYVDERTRAEIGEAEYSAFRREAFGVGVILTSDKSDYGVNRVYGSLQEQFPGKFRIDVDDPKGMLDEIVAAAREGKAENVSLAEMMGRVEKDTGWSVADQMEAMERKVDAAIDKFIEKAKLETDLKARSAVQMAQEREERRKAMERQAERKALQEQRRRVFKLLQKAKRYERQMPKDLREQLKGILEEMDTIAMGLANEMRWSDKYQATWRDLVDMYKNAEKYDPNFLPNPEILQMIERLEATKVAQLEPDALQEMFDVVTAIFEDWHNRKNMASAEEFALFSEVADNAIEELRSSTGRKKPKGKIRGAIADGSWKLFNADQLTPVNFIEMMGGWRRDGAFFKAFGRQGETGERNEKAYKVDAARMLDNFAREHADWMKTADGQGKSGVWHEYEVPVLGKPPKMGEEPQYIGTQKVWMTPMMRVHLYLESLNDQNMAHVQEGGRTFVDKALYSMGRRKEAFDNGVTVMMSKETVQSIVADMTAEEKAFAKMLHDYYNVYSPTKINPVSNVILGYDKAITENYAPIQTNESYNATQIGLFDITAEGVGVMKERVAKSRTPTYNVSALEAFERHVNQTARYVGYTIPVHNMQRLLNWKIGRYVADEDTGGERFVIETTMMDEIKRKWGQQGVDAIVKYLNDMQGSKPDERNAIQEIMAKVQSQYISATFGANPSVVLKQLGSFAMAGSELGFRNMPVIPRRVDTELIAKYTPELAHRKLSGATSETAYLKDNPNWTQSNKVMRFAFGGEAITWMDSLTAKALWPWAENYVRKNIPELEVGTREQIEAGQSPFYRKVAEVYNDAVTNTQSMADVSHRPTMQRSNRELARGMTLFKSDAIQGYNMLRRHAGEYARARKDGDKKAARTARVQLANSVTGIILSNVWGQSVTLLMALIANGAKWYRDDEGELTLQSVGTEFLSGLIKNMAGMVTLGEELASFILAKINGEGWSSDADIELLIVEAVNDMKDGLADAGSGLWSVAQEAYEIQRNGGNAGEYLKKHAGEVAGYVGSAAEVIATYIGGVPVKNLKKYLLGAFTAVWPELATSMKNVFTEPTKDALSGLRGESLAVTVGDILAIRDIQADDGTAAELARLYEAGERGGVPGAVTETFAVNGQDFTMNAAQLQEYERVYAEAVGGNLNALVESDAYIEADDETRAKMLERLYTYATQAAKRSVVPEYEGDTWTSKAAEAESEGVPVSAYVALQAQGFSKMADKIAYIDGMGITAEQKGVLYYYAVASDARREDADDMIEDGMGWDDVFSAAYEDLCAVIPDEPESADEPDEDKTVEPVGWTGYYPGLQLPVW